MSPMIPVSACGVALCLCLSACSSSAPAVAPDPAPSVVVDDLRAEPPRGEGIVKIQTRDRSVTLFAADHGVRRFTVEDDQGHVIARKVDLDSLGAIDARAYDLVRSTVAGGADTPQGD